MLMTLGFFYAIKYLGSVVLAQINYCLIAD